MPPEEPDKNKPKFGRYPALTAYGYKKYIQSRVEARRSESAISPELSADDCVLLWQFGIRVDQDIKI